MTTQAAIPAQSNARSRSPHPAFSSVLLAVVAFLATVLLVFVLPLFIPVKPVLGISASYLAGFNNSVAVLGATGISVLVFLATTFLNRQPYPITGASAATGKLSGRFVLGVIAGSSAVLALAGAAVMAAHQRYLGDAGYLIEQASTWSDTGRHLYSQIEFAYGPLLLLPEIALSRIAHLSMTQAYFIVLPVESALGLWMVAWLLNQLPVRPHLRQATLVLLALGALTPHLGLNYTFFRFASPLVFFLFAVRRAGSPGRTALLLSFALILQAAISPELAFALAVGVLAYAGLRTWQSGAAWLLAGVVPLTVLAVLLLSVGHGYLRMVSTFSAGVLNLPVGPYPHILILLFALTWLVPVYLGRSALFRDTYGSSLLGLYAIALAMIPAALRRCDPLHVFFNGTGILILSVAAVSRSSRPARILWVGCLALLVLWEHRVNEALFSWRTAWTVQHAILPHTPTALQPAVVALTTLPDRNLGSFFSQPPVSEEIPDLHAIYAIIGSGSLAIPFEIPPDMETALKDAHHYSPLSHAFAVDMMDSTAERAAVTELDGYQWLLLPNPLQLSSYQSFPNRLGPLQGMRMYFHTREPILFTPGEIFDRGIAREWTPVRSFGHFTLYRHRRSR